MTADHNVLQNEEANIISGALQLANKQVEDVMTKIEDVYMLNMNTVLDFEMMSEILQSGYTRVPVYDGDITNIVNILNTKELALIDPDDNTPVKTVCRFYDHRPLFVDYDLKLDAMLQDFLQGSSHMAMVQKLQNEGDCDPYYENVGVVTLEDVIEEIIQSEIVDETDILTDNRRKKPLERQRQLEYNVFEQKQEHGPRIPQQVAFAAYQFLSTAVDSFKEQYIARSVLKQLIRQNIFITMTPSADAVEKNYLYQRGQECDYFILLLEGHVEVEIGIENLVFESGPFTFFGVECLHILRDIKMENLRDSKDLRSLPPYTPDFSVLAVTPVQFLRIRRVHYLAARRTSYMMMTCSQSDNSHEQTFHDVWHRTVAASMSRNNSAAAINELPLDGSLNPLEVVQKLADGALTDNPVADSGQPHSAVNAETKEESGDSGSDREKSHLDSLLSASSLHSEGPVHAKQKARETSSPLLNDSHAYGENGESCVLLKSNYVDAEDRKSLSDAGSDSQERKVEKAMGDKVAVVNSKESRTISPGSPKRWAEDGEESAPLVSSEDLDDRTMEC
ncbi:hypothetical protein ACOMHN_007123 [Nucella lapillus]